MTITNKELEEFFSGYAQALSARNVPAIVRCWGVPGLVLSDEGAIPIANLEEVDAFFRGALQQYAKMASAHPTVESAQPLSNDVVACRLIWDHRDKDETSVGGEAGQYILKRDRDGLHIHVYTPWTTLK